MRESNKMSMSINYFIENKDVRITSTADTEYIWLRLNHDLVMTLSVEQAEELIKQVQQAIANYPLIEED